MSAVATLRSSAVPSLERHGTAMTPQDLAAWVIDWEMKCTTRPVPAVGS